MDDAEKQKRFAAARAERLKEDVRLQRAASAEVREELIRAQKNIIEILSGAPSDFRKWQLGALQESVKRALDELTVAANAPVQSGLGTAWQAGQALIDAPLAAASIDLSAHLMDIDTRRLLAMRNFSLDRIRDVSSELQRKIGSELAQAAIGTQTPFEAAQRIAEKLDGGLKRSLTITRHQLGTAFASAAQERQAQAVEIVPGLQKQWRRSGKTHSRIEHDLIDGQIRDVDKPFRLGNGVELMHPRDPAAPVGETINCGCSSIPYMAHWKMTTPARLQFSQDELNQNPTKRMIRDALEG